MEKFICSLNSLKIFLEIVLLSIIYKILINFLITKGKYTELLCFYAVALLADVCMLAPILFSYQWTISILLDPSLWMSTWFILLCHEGEQFNHTF